MSKSATPWGGALRDDTMNIGTITKLMGGKGSAKTYSHKGKLNEKNLCTPSNAKNIGAIAKKKPIQAEKNFFEKKFMRLLKFPTLPITYLMVRPLVVSLF